MYDLNLKNSRLEIISLFYRYFVLKYNKSQMAQDILSEKQMTWADETLEKMLLDLADKVDDLKADVMQHLKKEWSWERLPNLVKSGLIEGIFEIKYTTVPKPVTIDSITQIVKEMQPDWDYKFVNALLDNFNKPGQEGEDH